MVSLQSRPKAKTEITLTINLEMFDSESDDYSYDPPVYAIGQTVAIKQDYDFYLHEQAVMALEGQHSVIETPQTYVVTGIELMVYQTKDGYLKQQPYWTYAIQTTSGTREKLWLDENELIIPSDPDDTNWV